MKNLTQFLFMLLCICLPATAFADANKDKDDDSKYLAGAVPEVDGKVVFTKEFSIPGMSQEEIFKRMQNWMEARLKKNENTSRVVYTNPEEWGGLTFVVYSRFIPCICSSHTKLNGRDEFILEVNGYADFRTHKVASQQLASNAI